MGAAASAGVAEVAAEAWSACIAIYCMNLHLCIYEREVADDRGQQQEEVFSLFKHTPPTLVHQVFVTRFHWFESKLVKCY